MRGRETLHAWLMLGPALLLLAAFTHVPALATLWHSLFSTPRGGRPARFVGAENYAALFDDPVFLQALWNNFFYALGTVPLSIGLALAMALWVNGRIRGKAALRVAYFTPTVLPMIAVANLWLFFYTPDYGLVDRATALLLGWGPTNWLGSRETALGAMMAIAIWKEAGFFMIFYLAALQSIPPVLHEAAAVEGASRARIFWRVTLPLLGPTTLFIAVNAVINSVRLVDHILVMTQGGPDNATALLMTYIYETGFRFWDTAQASAATAVLLGLLALVAAAQFLLLGRRTHYR
ncbi:carbohydrate ABC transporter permease [Pseudoroseomonas cervicalis]|uniref:ABC transporter, permease protein n=1 Tax=Pseudoroseomonas cervicalis ATCC 49957 TaxID=525371 RepID=D5RN71_9PROT|nr:sugar ABC transporter permease [Pseudoroseomonas cervicalis]EFH11253.1 ABC transporter, permease protein [Pseudoroseomonas cervicalis ATCC 49957]WBV45166.1 sugar ABC transporter permease [Pseudoroseomonas cervicalis]